MSGSAPWRQRADDALWVVYGGRRALEAVGARLWRRQLERARGSSSPGHSAFRPAPPAAARWIDLSAGDEHLVRVPLA